jgi:hypothetical protein
MFIGDETMSTKNEIEALQKIKRNLESNSNILDGRTIECRASKKIVEMLELKKKRNLIELEDAKFYFEVCSRKED